MDINEWFLTLPLKRLEAAGSGGKVKLLCKVLGHLHPSGAQVFASVEQREADGAWLAVRGWCKRCDERPLLGSLWVQDYTARTLADAGKRESANAESNGGVSHPTRTPC